MLTYLSKTYGIGGTLKNAPENFIVEEITNDGTILTLSSEHGAVNKTLDSRLETKENEAGKFVHFILQKRNWSTSDAINAIAKCSHVSASRFNFAGTKDKVSISTQLASCFGLEKEKIESLNIKDIKINGAWYANDKVRLGDLLGNRFTIRV